MAITSVTLVSANCLISATILLGRMIFIDICNNKSKIISAEATDLNHVFVTFHTHTNTHTHCIQYIHDIQC